MTGDVYNLITSDGQMEATIHNMTWFINRRGAETQSRGRLLHGRKNVGQHK